MVLLLWICEVDVQWHSPERGSAAGQRSTLLGPPVKIQQADAVLIVASKDTPETEAASSVSLSKEHLVMTWEEPRVGGGGFSGNPLGGAISVI